MHNTIQATQLISNTCAHTVQNMCSTVWRTFELINTAPNTRPQMSKTHVSFQQMYTFFMHNLHIAVGNFIPVIYDLYTFYTALITKTTKYIN